MSKVTPGASAVTDGWPDLAGRLVTIDGRRAHRLGVRVYYEDTDFSGVAYHASYVRWCERGRSDFLRLIGSDHAGLLAGAAGGEPAALMVRRLEVDYLRPARIDEVLEVVTEVHEVGAATLMLKQAVVRLSADGTRIDLVRALVTIVLVTARGRVLRLSRVLGPMFSN